MADRSLFWKSASPRELKRSYSAVVSTGAGTASSIAALIVQRPSPESDTRPAKLASAGILEQRGRRQVEQPRRDHAAAPPHLGDVGQVEVVLVMRGIAQRRRLGVDRVRLLADVGRLEDAQAFRVRGHDPVLDAVVDHLHEVARAARPAVQVAVLGGAADLLAARRAIDVAAARGERLEDGIETLHASRRVRRSSCNSRARGPTRRRWCRRRRSRSSSARARARGGCRRCSTSCRRR